MKLTFRIEYRTAWGENLYVILSERENQPIALHTQDGVFWEGDADMPDAYAGIPITYRYGVFIDGNCRRMESGKPAHCFCPSKKRDCHYILNDCWKDLPASAYLYSSAFSTNTQSMHAPGFPVDGNRFLTIRALYPSQCNGKLKRIAICGEGDLLGNWNPHRALLMEELQTNEWCRTIDVSNVQGTITFKFITMDVMTGELDEWEAGDNRQFGIGILRKGEILFTPEMEITFPSMNRKIAGTAIPVFSLRSEGSYGVGDFGDLKLLLDWAEKTHQQAIQLLPINDTTSNYTWTDSYPYNGVSIYALHPMYLDLRQLGQLKDKKAAQAFEEERIKLNALPQLNYEEVNRAKRAYIQHLYQQNGKRTLASAEFKEFFRQNEDWLTPYAAFSYLRDEYNTPDFNHWPAHQIYQEADVKQICKVHEDKIAFYYYMQYHLHVQLLSASLYARKKGIILKGDIPIGINRCSVEAWVEPYYFNMNGQAGAPPDDFSADGQNWGFPTYNWEVMAKDNFQWWQRRFKKMAEYFTAYRIDHILGFFRIWEIPTHSVQGMLGQFSPALPMSPEEIESFGLPFHKERMTRPYITDKILDELFADRSSYVKETFLQSNKDGLWSMKPEFDTQRKVEGWFYGNGKDTEEDMELCTKLYTLINNVLFVVDHKNFSMYHPRICAQKATAFRQLNQLEQNAYNCLYQHYFYERHNQFWYQEAMKKLPTLTQCTDMLVCGEDLGMVPECVQWVMDQLQIMSLEVQRMPKFYGQRFGIPAQYPFNSVCTTSTHDTSTLRGWWEEDAERTQTYYHEVLDQWGETPTKAPGEICEEIVIKHLQSPSVLCILPFQDWTSIDEKIRLTDPQAERINDPSNSRHYWRYRMHLTLEELLAKNSFNRQLAKLIDESGRY